MKWISIPVLMMASICFYVCVYYLWMYIRRTDEPENLWFSLTCFTIGLYNVFCSGLYNSTTIADGLFWQRLQFASLALFSICILWFVYYYTHYGPRAVVYGLSSAMLVFFLLGISLGGEYTLTVSRPHPKIITLFNSVQFTYNEAQPGILYIIQYCCMLLGFVFLFYMLIRHYIYGDRHRLLPMLTAMGVFFAASVNDVLVGAGVYAFVFLLEYAYMFIIFSMVYLLQNRFMDLYGEVRELNTQLEEKVNDRTRELFFSEIGRELYVEMLTDISGPGRRRRVQSENNAGRTKGLSSIEKLSRDISIISNFNELLRMAITKAVEISNSQLGGIFFLDENGTLVCRAEYPPDSEEKRRYPTEMLKKSLKKGELPAVPDATEKMNEPNPLSVTIPIKVDNNLVGVCYLEKSARSDGYRLEDRRLISALIEQSTIAFENAFLYQRMANTTKNTRISLTGDIVDKMNSAIRYLCENYTSDISREGLAASLNMHPDSLGRYFKLYTGRKLGDYINELRIKDAARLMLESDRNIIDIAFSVGFESIPTFNRAFSKCLNTTPTAYREKRGKS